MCRDDIVPMNDVLSFPLGTTTNSFVFCVVPRMLQCNAHKYFNFQLLVIEDLRKPTSPAVSLKRILISPESRSTIILYGYEIKCDETYYNIAAPQIIIYLYKLYTCTMHLHGAMIRAILRIQWIYTIHLILFNRVTSNKCCFWTFLHLIFHRFPLQVKDVYEL